MPYSGPWPYCCFIISSNFYRLAFEIFAMPGAGGADFFEGLKSNVRIANDFFGLSSKSSVLSYFLIVVDLVGDLVGDYLISKT